MSLGHCLISRQSNVCQLRGIQTGQLPTLMAQGPRVQKERQQMQAGKTGQSNEQRVHDDPRLSAALLMCWLSCISLLDCYAKLCDT
jgi:hypothetical protein